MVAIEGLRAELSQDATVYQGAVVHLGDVLLVGAGGAGLAGTRSTRRRRSSCLVALALILLTTSMPCRRLAKGTQPFSEESLTSNGDCENTSGGAMAWHPPLFSVPGQVPQATFVSNVSYAAAEYEVPSM